MNLVNYDFEVGEDTQKKQRTKQLIESYKSSEPYLKTRREIDQILDSQKESVIQKKIPLYANNFFYQTWILLHRTFLLYIKV